MKKIEELICQLKGISEIFGGADIMMKFQKSTDDNLGKLPTSREALSQHVRRLCYQAVYLWKDCQSDLILPKPNKWGWVFDEKQRFIFGYHLCRLLIWKSLLQHVLARIVNAVVQQKPSPRLCGDE